jgi:6-pyruvoyltetrahydropterin/6-carboxytetrahydropterin synthase
MKEAKMQRFQVTKVLEFAYGHRLLDYEGKCRHLHGHNGVLEVDIDSDALDKLGMVIDFGEVNDIIKTWVNDNLDHRMLLCKKDPIVPVLQSMDEPMFLMDENPTAENIAKTIWLAARSAGLKVSEVRLWETGNSRATYRGEQWDE